ncbi:photosystem I assembly protein Ycf4 [Lusitaniella coriacea LEGE 07157]|uniref:Photosystem I assembly protein Ycf4 n=1 Tax=Lusitaniella coriacea LEGE 07157 TaxID=945747 RepID=A0A8J7E1L7_9CYAN|nr:photosystem I assembly protein Ycf4 [Lusitaniella coriacea LEGE 07157]
MTAKAETQNRLVLRKEIIGSRRLSNYLLAVATSIGGLGFFLAGLSSYLGINLLFVSDPSQLVFIPQGIALGFYGVAGLLVATYLWLTIYWDIGAGYNEFSKETGQAKIVRWGFPGKNRQVELVCPLDEIQSVKARIKEGLNPKHSLYLKVKKTRDIPLTRVGEPVPLTKLENEGAELAKFLGVPLEGF